MLQDTGVILAAAGIGRRFGAKKQFLSLLGKPLLHYSLATFSDIASVREIVVVVPQSDTQRATELIEAWRPATRANAAATAAPPPSVSVRPGGKRRQDSVRQGLEALTDAVKYVLVHDAARPLLRREDADNLLREIRAHGAAVIGTPCSDSLKRVDAQRAILDEVERESIWCVQTPQGARRDLLLTAYAEQGERDWTDEASLLRAAGVEPRLVEGSRDNFKITSSGDEQLAVAILETRRRASDTKR